MKEDVKSALIRLCLAPAFVHLLCSVREQQAGFGVGSWEGLEICTSQPREEQSPVTAPSLCSADLEHLDPTDL